MDIVSDSEIRRESYSNRFATAVEDVDLSKFGIGSTAVMMPPVNAGTLRGIAVTSSERAPGMPKTATFKEAGFDGMAAYA
jgi:tripartite-type tricarboxylate transporter receptor subunit TctC